MNRPRDPRRRTVLQGGAACLAGALLPLDPPPATRTRPTPLRPHLPTAHSHNDYRQPRPFDLATELGFGSLEVDVIPADGRLLVGHDRTELRPDRQLESMYLAPIAARLRDDAAPDHRTTLLLDIKRDPDRTLDLLLPLLEPLQPFLRRVESGRLIDGPLEVVISGSRPRERIEAMESRALFVDGRPDDLEADPPVELVPMISSSMKAALGTYGLQGLDEQALERLRTLAARTHAQGRRLRFWGHFEWPAIWKALVDAKVDHIGTDQPKTLAAWLRENDPRCR